MIDKGGPISPLHSSVPHPFCWSDQSHLNNTLPCFRAQLSLTVLQGLVTEPQAGPLFFTNCFLNHVVLDFLNLCGLILKIVPVCL